MMHPRRWLLTICLIFACAVLPACGGNDNGGLVTGDSPEGIDVDSPLIDTATEGGQAIPSGSDEEPDVEQSLTDGQ